MTAPRPRVSEHTDAARLEALRDSMRPRVEGEDQANVEAEAWELIQALAKAGDRVRDYVGGLNRRHVEMTDRTAALTAEVARLRKFAEKMITPCEWGPSAFIEEDESDISDWALSHGLLVERVHAQPCEVEGCECDGSPTLLYFAWSPEAAALALPTNAPEAKE